MSHYKDIMDYAEAKQSDKYIFDNRKGAVSIESQMKEILNS